MMTNELELEIRDIDATLEALSPMTEALMRLATPSFYRDEDQILGLLCTAFPCLRTAPKDLDALEVWGEQFDSLSAERYAIDVVGIVCGRRDRIDVVRAALALPKTERAVLARWIEMQSVGWRAVEIPEAPGRFQDTVEKARNLSRQGRDSLAYEALLTLVEEAGASTGPSKTLALFLESVTTGESLFLDADTLAPFERAVLAAWASEPFILSC